MHSALALRSHDQLQASCWQTWKKRVLRVLQNPNLFRFSAKYVLFFTKCFPNFTKGYQSLPNLPNFTKFLTKFTKFYQICTKCMTNTVLLQFQIVVMDAFSPPPNLYPQKVRVDIKITFSSLPLPYPPPQIINSKKFQRGLTIF